MSSVRLKLSVTPRSILKGALTYKPGPTSDPRRHYQYGSDDLMRRIDREGSNAQDQTSTIWDADEQRLQLQEEAAYANWQFLYDTAAGVPAVLVEQPEDVSWDETPTYFVREPGGELLASFESGESANYYHFDALGSTVLISDPSGSPVQNYAYTAWGEVLNSPAISQPYQYVGKLGYYTHHSGQGAEIENWLQLGVRFYQPELGKYGQSASPYAYASNSPTVKTEGGKLPKLPKPKDYAECAGKAIEKCRSEKDPKKYGKCIEKALLQCLGKAFEKVNCPDFVCLFAKEGVFSRLFPGTAGAWIRGVEKEIAGFDCQMGNPCKREGFGYACCGVKALCDALNGTELNKIRTVYTTCLINACGDGEYQ